jgi:hypothetical protein
MVIIQRGIEREIPCGHPLFHLDDVALFDVKITGKVFVLRFALTVCLQGFSHFSNLIEKLLLGLSCSDFYETPGFYDEVLNISPDPSDGI